MNLLFGAYSLEMFAIIGTIIAAYFADKLVVNSNIGAKDDVTTEEIYALIFALDECERKNIEIRQALTSKQFNTMQLAMESERRSTLKAYSFSKHIADPHFEKDVNYEVVDQEKEEALSELQLRILRIVSRRGAESKLSDSK